MANQSNVEIVGQLNPKKLTSLEEDRRKGQAEILADQAHWKKHGINRRKGQSKSEIIEKLSRERFPWEG